MNERLVQRLADIKNNRDQLLNNEEATKQWAILPVLECVGWDIRAIGEVVPEYAVGGGKVDYCLKHSGREQCFVEAKNPGLDLQKSQEQLLRYVFEAKADLAVLTNGVTWWFYLPHEGGAWEEKRFFVVDLEKQDPSSAAGHLEQFLGKASLLSGDAIKKAREVLRGRERGRLVEQTLPQAWEQLLKQSDESLCKPISDRTEGICGHRPGTDEVVAFLRKLKMHIEGPNGPDGPDDPEDTPQVTGKRPLAFTFRGRRKVIRTWAELPSGLADMLYAENPQGFRRLLEIRWGRRCQRVATSNRGMRNPVRIADSDMYVERFGNAQGLVSAALRMLRELGYSRDALHIEAE